METEERYTLRNMPKTFFYGPGEPWDTDDIQTNSEGEATSVWSAILLWFRDHPTQWNALALKHWSLKKGQARLLMIEAVMLKIRCTGHHTKFARHWEVWIDDAGEFRLIVGRRD